ncbi:beta-L-arabinofuranosidase domain-containing protein [Maribellus maritimus]|uniref:beta-L-arabinofuranosidase domain-containing protein n=1 Tax=Maribellus maritimus TaxID=2870838 RepID=UPI001EEC7826|nr:beta-L-arabinofuranosidase domain-containing protein [Maribellus maritimus]MCG6187639.1 glycoside hydrolase family 127 protein [Maribellus maritimus]
MKQINIIIFCLLLLVGKGICGDNKPEPSYHPKYKILKVGEVTARGWIKEQMKRDLNEGYLSCFEKICPFVNQDVFNTNRMKSTERFSEYPHLLGWWGAEPEGYLKDGIIRMAIQSGDTAFILRANEWMERLLKFQGEDGYIGMYVAGDEPNTRFNHTYENGELWVQSRIMSAMLAWYEYTGDIRYLEAVNRAAKLSVLQYTDRSYFQSPPEGEKQGGGISHAVGFFDILEWMYRLTKEKLYLDFAVKFYNDFNKGPVRDDDLTMTNLLAKNKKWEKHTPHIMEGLYMAELVASITQDSEIQKAADMSVRKLKEHITPGGGVVGDESVKGRPGTADAYREYCGMTEMVFSLNRLISISGNLQLGDFVERTVFNAGQGARLPVLKALEYLSSDNRVTINSCDHGGRLAYDSNRFSCKKGVFDSNSYKQQAICCVTSGPRLLPYFIDGMWMKNTDAPGLTAMFYGPVELNTDINGVKVKISERTDYPFSDLINFSVEPEKSVSFALCFRIPEGVSNVEVKELKDANIVRKQEQIIITKKWQTGDTLEIKFVMNSKLIPHPVSETVPSPGFFVQRGPLVYALPFSYELVESYEYNNTGFYRYEVNTMDSTGWNYLIDSDSKFSITENKKANKLSPWEESPLYLKGKLIDEKGNKRNVQLIPEGCTVLRRVAFPAK